MTSKKILILPAILSLVMISMGPAFAASSSISSLTVGDSCGVSVTNSLEFGNVSPGNQSNEYSLVITGTGNTGSVVTVYASDWLDPVTGDNIVDGENTRVGLILNESFTSKLALNDTNTASIGVGNVTNQANATTYWQVELLVNDPEFGGEIQQTITFNVDDCV